MHIVKRSENYYKNWKLEAVISEIVQESLLLNCVCLC